MARSAGSTAWLFALCVACACSDAERRVSELPRPFDASVTSDAGDLTPDASDASDANVPATHDHLVAVGPGLCGAATDSTSCERVRLPEVQTCEDCLFACRWLPFYEVSYADGGCEYGESEPVGACVFIHGEGYDSLIDQCARGSVNTVLVQRGDVTRIALSLAPTASAASCSVVNGSFLPAPECACPCLAGFPEQACEERQQSFAPRTPSGVEACSGVPPHRVRADACSNDFEDTECHSDDGECVNDDDCTNGECVRCHCVETCTTDADCADDEACACRDELSRFSRCVPAHCKTDDDCSGDQVCAVSYFEPDGELCRATALACREPFRDCDGVLCSALEECMFEAASSRWRCVPVAQQCHR